MTRAAVLLTGATGQVGSAVAELLRRRGAEVVALVHENRTIAGARGRVAASVEGDVRRPDLGIGSKAVAELGGRVGLVVHCATTTDPALPDGRHDDVNVTGTAQAVALAQRWGAAFLHLSAVHVFGPARGSFAESDFEAGQQLGSAYERSKYEAERLVRACGLPWTVVRHGFLFGAKRNGSTRSPGGLHAVLRLLALGQVRVVPGNRGATLWLSPVDHVGRVVCAAAGRAGRAEGRTFHATGADALTMGEFVDVFAEYPSFALPDLVAPDAFADSSLDERQREQLRRVVAPYLPYFRHKQRFESSGVRADLGLVPPRTGAEYYRKNLDACLGAGFFDQQEEPARR